MALDVGRGHPKAGPVTRTGFACVSTSDYFDVFEHAEQRVVLARRGPRSVAGIDELRSVAWSLQGLLEPRWAGWGLVIDTRDAAGTNDPRFEQELIDWCAQACEHFARLAILVRTSVGQRQATRHIRTAPNAIATLDEDHAHAWAAGR